MCTLYSLMCFNCICHCINLLAFKNIAVFLYIYTSGSWYISNAELTGEYYFAWVKEFVGCNILIDAFHSSGFFIPMFSFYTRVYFFSYALMLNHQFACCWECVLPQDIYIYVKAVISSVPCSKCYHCQFTLFTFLSF